MRTFNLREFLARSTDKPFEETDLGKALESLPPLQKDGPWLAGGALRRTLLGQSIDSDFDLFFRDEAQLVAVGDVLDAVGWRRGTETDHVVNFFNGDLKVQLIRFAYYANLEAVADSFDFTICMLATDGENIAVGDYTLWDLGRKRLAVHKITFPVSSLRRVLKYANQGFIACKGALTSILKETVEKEELQRNLDVKYVD